MFQPEDGYVAPDACGLSHLKFLADLPKATLRELQAMCRVLRYDSGQVVVPEGQVPEFVGCVVHGVLRMQKTLEDGRQHIVGLLVEGDIFGRINDGPLNLSIEAAADTELCVFESERFEALLARSHELDRALLLKVLDELDRARDWMTLLANPRVKGRLSGFILILRTRFAEVDHLVQRGKQGVMVNIPINRTDLAHLLGTRPESISRAFHALATDGTIVINRPDQIEILDIDALAEEAGDDYLPNDIPLRDVV